MSLFRQARGNAVIVYVTRFCNL